MKKNFEEEFLKITEAAKRYRTSPQVFYRWVAENRFPENVVFRIGRKILIHRINLEIFENSGGELSGNKGDRNK